MSFASTIRISKLQSKHHMMGQACNPGGHTSASLDKRDSDFLELFHNMSYEEKKKRINSLKKHSKFCKSKGISQDFEYNLLERHRLLDLRNLKGGIKNVKN